MSISDVDDRLGISFSDGPSLDLCNIPDVLSSAGDAHEIAEQLLAVDQHDSGSDCVAMDSPEDEPYIDVVSEDSAIQEENLDGSCIVRCSHTSDASSFGIPPKLSMIHLLNLTQHSEKLSSAALISRFLLQISR